LADLCFADPVSADASGVLERGVTVLAADRFRQDFLFAERAGMRCGRLIWHDDPF